MDGLLVWCVVVGVEKEGHNRECPIDYARAQQIENLYMSIIPCFKELILIGWKFSFTQTLEITTIKPVYKSTTNSTRMSDSTLTQKEGIPWLILKLRGGLAMIGN